MLLRLTFIAILVSMLIVPPTLAQQAGRPQDGFYSGQPTSRSGELPNGQTSERVNGRANRNEGVGPTAGDAAKNAPAVTARPPDSQAQVRTERPLFGD
jgi:hypothetical protein